MEVPIGTPIRDLIEFCGGYRGEVALLILGGNMMGYALRRRIARYQAGNCILAAHADDVGNSGMAGHSLAMRHVCRLECPGTLRASAVQDFDARALA